MNNHVSFPLEEGFSASPVAQPWLFPHHSICLLDATLSLLVPSLPSSPALFPRSSPKWISISPSTHSSISTDLTNKPKIFGKHLSVLSTCRFFSPLSWLSKHYSITNYLHSISWQSAYAAQRGFKAYGKMCRGSMQIILDETRPSPDAATW